MLAMPLSPLRVDVVSMSGGATTASWGKGGENVSPNVVGAGAGAGAGAAADKTPSSQSLTHHLAVLGFEPGASPANAAALLEASSPTATTRAHGFPPGSEVPLARKRFYPPLRFFTAAVNKPMAGKTNRGEDAFFATACGRGIGVADGVGGWTRLGVDAGEYSRKLMGLCDVRIGRMGWLNPREVLQSAYDGMGSTVGSTTACLLTLREGSANSAPVPVVNRPGSFRTVSSVPAPQAPHEQPQPQQQQPAAPRAQPHRLSAVNLGDSGFVVFRYREDVGEGEGGVVGERKGRWAVHTRTREQTHRFNCPLQLGTNVDDKPAHGDSYEVAVRSGDVVVVATDGVFDNLFDEDIAEALDKMFDPRVLRAEHARGRLCDVLNSAADCVAHLATVASQDATCETPFSYAAKHHGVFHRGGKPDDITVLVSAIMAVSDEAKEDDDEAENASSSEGEEVVMRDRDRTPEPVPSAANIGVDVGVGVSVGVSASVAAATAVWASPGQSSFKRGRPASSSFSSTTSTTTTAFVPESPQQRPQQQQQAS